MFWDSEINEYVVLGIDGVFTYVFYLLYRHTDKVIKNILNATVVNVGEGLESFFDSKVTEVPYLVLRGKVKDFGQTLESSNGLKGVLQTVTINEHSRRYAPGRWTDDVRVIQEAKNAVPFGLSSLYQESGQIVEVEYPYDAEIENLMITVSSKFTPANTSIASAFMGFFSGVAVKGIEQTEEFLPLETIVTGIGSVVRDSNGVLKLTKPKYKSSEFPFVLSTLPAEAIAKQLETKSFWYKVATLFFVSVGTIIIIRKARKYLRVKAEERMRETVLKLRSQIDTQGLHESQICSVCLINPKEMILLQCGHVCVCSDCCSKLNNKCPICRKSFTEARPAFIV